MLETLGAAAVGSVGLGRGAGVAIASHGGDFITKKEIENVKSEWGETGKLKLSACTSLGYVDTYSVGDYVYHKMYFSTTAGTEWDERNEKAENITNHSITVDGSDPQFLSDIYDARTGISNTANGDDDAAENLATLAKAALELAEDGLAFPLDVLEAATAFIDLFTDDSQNEYIRGRSYDRLGHLDSTPPKAKHQGHFEIEVPPDSSGWVTFDSTTIGKEYGVSGFDPAELTITNRFELWVDRQDVAIYERRF